jgi:hypothetical protein
MIWGFNFELWVWLVLYFYVVGFQFFILGLACFEYVLWVLYVMVSMKHVNSSN